MMIISHALETGIDVRNPRGNMLLNFMQTEQLYCMNTFCKKAVHCKWTWQSPDGKTKNEIGFVISVMFLPFDFCILRCLLF